MSAARPIVPLETPYKGFRFRSRLEARWAVFYDLIGVSWSYENDPVRVDGTNYLPDFRVTISGQSIIHEVKPEFEKERIRPVRVYVAGKMTSAGDWRGTVLGRMRDRVLSGQADAPSFEHIGETEIIYTGPFPATEICDGVHGTYSDWSRAPGLSSEHLRSIADSSMLGIQQCEIFCAHINSPDCHGTLVEIGLAKALGKTLSVSILQELTECDTPEDGDHNDTLGTHDLWFPLELAHHTQTVESNAEARLFHESIIRERTAPEYQTLARMAALGERVCLTFGDPFAPFVRDWCNSGLQKLCVANSREAAKARGHRFVG